jgi:precorrin-6A/cobalt-precorrin-6A reductase
MPGSTSAKKATPEPYARPMRVLILGGTSEARALAALLHEDPAFEVVSSLAGRVRDPALPAGAYVIGGFGGIGGLVTFLAERQIEAVVDATHPYARAMTAHAIAACHTAGMPLLRVQRPGWEEAPGDRWHPVDSVAAAAGQVLTLAEPGDTVFVTTGRQELAPFAPDRERHYLIRTVDPPGGGLPPRHTLLLDRGPYTFEGELALLQKHDVRVLVTKNSGGPMTYPKVEAARAAGLAVVVVERPPLPEGGRIPVETPAQAYAWCQDLFGS